MQESGMGAHPQVAPTQLDAIEIPMGLPSGPEAGELRSPKSRNPGECGENSWARGSHRTEAYS
jgi:hypothetical protein